MLKHDLISVARHQNVLVNYFICAGCTNTFPPVSVSLTVFLFFCPSYVCLQNAQPLPLKTSISCYIPLVLSDVSL